MRDASATIELPTGRRLGYAELGDRAGSPVLHFHGFPGSRLEAGLMAEAARELGLRLISPDRPGYGLSDPLPGRRIADWPADVAALASALGIEDFGVVGVSGGGPYALACAHQLGARLTGTVLVGGLGPLQRFADSRGMGVPARVALALVQAAPRLGEWIYARLVGPLMRALPRAMLALLTSAAPKADRRVLSDAGVRAQLIASIGEAFRQGGDGAAWDLVLYTQPWGFDASAIGQPIALWHGEADRTVPVWHGRRLAALIPRCEPRFLPGEGHFSLPIRHTRAILQGLA